ncbi:uncharacterized protein BN536_00017 [Phocaeicola plebeius CAG:211]|uniref:Uncharacterized protein n=1 Tax=Phocaeicola plebeius CAG:211 TaxID=1263052 RepID=R5VL59_9BACT|nr:uncharacterized protein BN536_00017 [Phocaeicola plebeius CAG:211]
MDTVGNHFYAHSVCQVYTFYCTLIFVFTAFVESRHCIVEMCGVSESGFECGLDFRIFGFSVSDRSQNAFRTSVSCKIMSSRKLRADVPALDALCAFQQGNVFFRIWIFQELFPLCSGHFLIEVRTFNMKPLNNAFGCFHQFFTCSYCAFDIIKAGRT